MSDLVLSTGHAQGEMDRHSPMERRRASRQPPNALHPNGNPQVSVNGSPIAGAWKAAVDLAGGESCVGILNLSNPNVRGTIFSSGCSQSDLTFMNVESLRAWLEASVAHADHDGAHVLMVDPREVAEVANLPWLKHLSALAVGRAEVSSEGALWVLIGWRSQVESKIDRRRLALSLRVLAHCAISYNDYARREKRLQILEGMIDELAPALMLVNATAQVFWTNYRAELILAERRLLVRNGGNMLASRTAANTALLRQAIAEAISSPPRVDEESDRYLLLPGDDDGGEDVIVLRPVAGRHGLEGNRAVMVILPQNDMLTLAAKLVGLYGLIPSEARFVSAIVQTGSSAHAAIQLGITEQTAKTYMKRIYAKLGVNNQLELGMLFASLAPPLRSTPVPLAGAPQHINTF
jgi:DNA-binding CsgD family transcriptional regulator